MSQAQSENENMQIDLNSGAADPLPFMKNFKPLVNNKPSSNTWKLTDGDGDDDLIDEDELLDEEDLKRPDPASLKACGTTGKRKACKDCSCGLAEELAGETKNTKDTLAVKSSCGSCYLGDAFRCAACPYLGTPAFKPGEKVQLSDTMLNADA